LYPLDKDLYAQRHSDRMLFLKAQAGWLARRRLRENGQKPPRCCHITLVFCDQASQRTAKPIRLRNILPDDPMHPC
jgi:hypothetical protein